MNTKYKQLLDKIISYDTIILFSHIRSDGDCYGSGIGLKDIILTSFPEKKVYYLGEYSNTFQFLGKQDIIDEADNDKYFPNAYGIILDTGVNDRVYDQRFKLCKEIAKIDHHDESEQEKGITIVKNRYPANCQIIFEFFQTVRPHLEISPVGATALYTGILTDTGAFKYRGVSDKTFFAAGHLVKLGADPTWINETLGETTLEQIKFHGYVLSHMETVGKFIFCKVSAKLFKEYNINYEDGTGFVNSMAGLKQYPIWGLIIEQDNGSIRIRLRSRNIDLIELGKKYGGGGHPNAIGINLENPALLKPFVIDASTYE